MARRSGRAPAGAGVCGWRVLAFAAVLAAAPAAAVDYVWTNPVSGNWNTAANWTPNGVPNSNADTATIAVAGTYTVTVNGGFTVKTLTLGGASGTQTLALPSTRSLVLNANTGTATMTVNASGVFEQSGGDLVGTPPVPQVAMNGLWNWTGGNVTAGVAVTIGPAATLAAFGSLAKTLSGGGTVLTNNGTITLGGTQGMFVENNATLTNTANGLVDLQAGVGIAQTGAGTSTLNNAGLLRKSVAIGGSVISLVAINNTGTIDVQTSTLLVTQPFGAGAVQSTGAGNALNAQAGATLTINAITSATFGGTTFGGTGVKTFGTGSVLHNYSGTIAATNTTINGGEHRGTFTLNGELALHGGTMGGSGSFDLTIPAGATLILGGSGTKQLVGSGSPVAITNSGTMRFNTTSNLQGNNQALIQNTAGGLIEFLGGGLGTTGTASPSVLVNAGTVRFATPTTVSVASWSIVNTGTISVQSSVLAWFGANASFGQTAGRLELVGGNMSNQQHLSISGGVLAGTGTIQGLGAVNLSGPAQTRPGTSPGRLTFGGPITQTGTLFVELNGTTPGTQYDQLVANGAVTLGGTLTVSLGFVPPVGTEFRIIDKTSAGPVVGAFSGMPQGHVFIVNGVQLQISYAGGDGNDVTLTVFQNSGLICTPFTDVDQASPFCPNVQWMKNRGVTIGCTSTLYCSAQDTTRLQMAVFMNRLGNVLSGVPQTLLFPSVSLTGLATEVICHQASDQAAALYERHVTLDAVLMGLGSDNAEYTLEPVASVDAGANWISLAPPAQFSTVNGHWANVRVSGDRDVAPTEAVRYGLRLTRTAGVGFAEARCALRLVTGNRVTGTPP